MSATITRRETTPTPIPEINQPTVPPRRPRRISLAAAAIAGLVVATALLVSQVAFTPSDELAPARVADSSYDRSEDARFGRLAPGGVGDGSDVRNEDARFGRLVPGGVGDGSDVRNEDARFGRLVPSVVGDGSDVRNEDERFGRLAPGGGR